MKNFFAALLLVVATFVTVIPANAHGSYGNDYTMQIVNNSSYTIYRVYASNRDSRYWGENLLKRNLYPGKSVVIDVDDHSGYCIYDLSAEGSQKSEWEHYEVNVCEQYWWKLYD